MLKAESDYASLLEQVHPSQKKSAVNLLHYLVFRSHNMEDLHTVLEDEGYSSLTNAEGHIQHRVLSVLKHFMNVPNPAPCNLSECQTMQEKRVHQLFGNTPGSKESAIMVTLKTAHASDFIMIKKFLRSSMSIARINCAHDNEKDWMNMIKNIRSASEITGLPCKIYMDLAGTKIRTRIKGEKKNKIRLEENDEFILTDHENAKSKLPVVHTTLPGLAAQLKPEQRVFFDDGLFEAKVLSSNNGEALLEIIRAPTEKPFLKSEKGINLPDSKIPVMALTKEDRKNLSFVLQHADMVGYSFVQNVTDLMELRKEMKDKKIPVILKIETPEAFYNLPKLLFLAMQDELYGIMIARGDLAVELGFENLGVVQEEITRLCHAAHAPMIWATQVLENLNKKGVPNRAEISDVSLGAAADCIMLNKGDYTVQSIKALKKILQQTSRYHFKNKQVLKPLMLAKRFFQHRN